MVHAHLSEGSLVRGLGFICSEVHLSGGSFVRVFTSLYIEISSTMTFLAEIEAVLMKRILGLFRFEVTTPRDRHSQGSPLPERCCSAEIYTYGRYCDAEIYKGHAVLLEHTWAMLFCWKIFKGDAVLLKFKHGRCCSAGVLWQNFPAFPPVFHFLLSCNLMWADLYCVADLLNGRAYR